jgi:hypothetical protein
MTVTQRTGDNNNDSVTVVRALREYDATGRVCGATGQVRRATGRVCGPVWGYGAMAMTAGHRAHSPMLLDIV